MFYNMRNSGRIRRSRAESNVEYFIVIFIPDQHDPCPALFVAEKISFRADIRQRFLLKQFISL